MKKAIIFLILLVAINVSAFSLTHEFLFSLGYEFGEFGEFNESSGESLVESKGINLSVYFFFDEENYGTYAHFYFGIPGLVKSNSAEEPFFGSHGGATFGLGFRHDFTEKLKLRYAAGLNFFVSSYQFYGYSPLYTNGYASFNALQGDFGIGGDISINLNLTRMVFLSTGAVFTIDFLRLKYMEATFGTSSSGIDKGFFKIGICACICVGVYLYQ